MTTPTREEVERITACAEVIHKHAPNGMPWSACLDAARELRRLHERPGGALADTFQSRVYNWMLVCFGAEISADRQERNHRFVEEAVELAQSCGCTASEAHQIVDYVFGRPIGNQVQEVGGVMVTLAALCLAHGMDMRYYVAAATRQPFHMAGRIAMSRGREERSWTGRFGGHSLLGGGRGMKSANWIRKFWRGRAFSCDKPIELDMVDRTNRNHTKDSGMSQALAGLAPRRVVARPRTKPDCPICAPKRQYHKELGHARIKRVQESFTAARKGNGLFGLKD